jgi:hypothetical protein
VPLARSYVICPLAVGAVTAADVTATLTERAAAIAAAGTYATDPAVPSTAMAGIARSRLIRMIASVGLETGNPVGRFGRSALTYFSTYLSHMPGHTGPYLRSDFPSTFNY